MLPVNHNRALKTAINWENAIYQIDNCYKLKTAYVQSAGKGANTACLRRVNALGTSSIIHRFSGCTVLPRAAAQHSLEHFHGT